MVRLVALGIETRDSARKLIGVTPRQALFIAPNQVAYRLAVLREFERLADAQPPPPPPTSPTPRVTIKAPSALVTVTETGTPKAEVVVPKKASPDAAAILKATANFFGLTV